LLLCNYLLILEMLAETVIGLCSLVPTSYWLQGKCTRTNLSQAASGTILQNHTWLPVSIFSVKITALGSLKQVSERIIKNSKEFHMCTLKI
jgi:hypothetical protein